MLDIKNFEKDFVFEFLGYLGYFFLDKREILGVKTVEIHCLNLLHAHIICCFGKKSMKSINDTENRWCIS